MVENTIQFLKNFSWQWDCNITLMVVRLYVDILTDVVTGNTRPLALCLRPNPTRENTHEQPYCHLSYIA